MEKKPSISKSVTHNDLSQEFDDQQLGAPCEKKCDTKGKRSCLSKIWLAIRLLLLVNIGLVVTACIYYPENKIVQNCKEYVIVGVLIFLALKILCMIAKFFWRRTSSHHEKKQNSGVPLKILFSLSGGIVGVIWVYFPENRVVQTSKENIIVTPLLLLVFRILAVMTRIVLRCFNCVRYEKRGILWKLLLCLCFGAISATWIYYPENDIVQKSKLYTFGSILAVLGLKMLTIISKLFWRCLRSARFRIRRGTLKFLVFVCSCSLAVPWIYYPENEAVQKSKEYVLTGILAVVGLKASIVTSRCLWRYSRSDNRRKVPWKFLMLTSCGLVGTAWIYFPGNCIVQKSKEYVMVSTLAIMGLKVFTIFSKLMYRCLKSIRRERRKHVCRLLFVVLCGLAVAAYANLPGKEAVQNSKEYVIVSLLALGIPRVLALFFGFYRWVFKYTAYGKKAIFCKILFLKSIAIIGVASVYLPENKIVRRSQEYLIAGLSAIVAVVILVKTLKLVWRYVKPARKDAKDVVDSGDTKTSKIETQEHKKYVTKSKTISDEHMKSGTKKTERQYENVSYSSKQGPGFDLFHTPRNIDRKRQEEYTMRRTFSGGYTEVWEDFLQNHETMASLNNYGQEKSRRVLLSTLRGPAGLYAYGLPLCIQRNYDRLVEKMGERFGYSAMQAKIENGNNGQLGVSARKTT